MQLALIDMANDKQSLKAEKRGYSLKARTERRN